MENENDWLHQDGTFFYWSICNLCFAVTHQASAMGRLKALLHVDVFSRRFGAVAGDSW